MKVFNSVAIVVLLIVIVGAALMYSGVYNVAADKANAKPIDWFLDTVATQSVADRAAQITPPDNLEEAAMIRDGARHYNEMCAGCHLSPGVVESALHDGLNPRPPKLSLPMNLSASEVFWTIKHGIKLTGMPAWGASHSDKELWDITAFVMRLPFTNADEYSELVGAAANAELSEAVVPVVSGKPESVAATPKS